MLIVVLLPAALALIAMIAVISRMFYLPTLPASRSARAEARSGENLNRRGAKDLETAIRELRKQGIGNR